MYICIHIHTMNTMHTIKYNMSYWSIRPQEAALSSTASKLFELTAVQDGPCHHAWESDSWITHQLWQATIYWHGFPNLYDFTMFSNVFLADSGWVHAKVSAEFLVLCSIVFLLYKCSLSILINICTRNFILLLKKKVSKVFFIFFLWFYSVSNWKNCQVFCKHALLSVSPDWIFR